MALFRWPFYRLIARAYASPEELAKQGDEALALGDFDKATRLYGEAINGDSSNAQFVRDFLVQYPYSMCNQCPNPVETNL